MIKLIFFLGLALRIIVLYFRPIAPDELWTLYYIKNDIATIIDGSFADFRPPLYYLILLPWKTVFSDIIFSLRLFSFLTSMTTLVFIYKSARLLLNKKQVHFTLLLTIIAAGFLYDASDARMFALGTLSSSVLLWSTISYLKFNTRHYLIYVTMALLIACYSYLYLLLLIPSVFMSLLTTNSLSKKRFLILQTVVVVFLLPIFYYLIKFLPYFSSFHQKLSANPLKILIAFIVPFIPSEILFVELSQKPFNFLFLGLVFLIFSISLLLVISGFRLSSWLLKKLFIAFFVLPLSILFLFSIFVKPVIGIHSLIFFSPIMFIVIAKNTTSRPKIIRFLLLIAAISTSYYLANLDKLQTNLSPYKYLQTHYRKGDLILQENIYQFLWTRFMLSDPYQKAVKPSSFNQKIEQVFGYSSIDCSTINSPRIFLLSTSEDGCLTITILNSK